MSNHHKIRAKPPDRSSGAVGGRRSKQAAHVGGQGQKSFLRPVSELFPWDSITEGLSTPPHPPTPPSSSPALRHASVTQPSASAPPRGQLPNQRTQPSGTALPHWGTSFPAHFFLTVVFLDTVLLRVFSKGHLEGTGSLFGLFISRWKGVEFSLKSPIFSLASRAI